MPEGHLRARGQMEAPFALEPQKKKSGQSGDCKGGESHPPTNEAAHDQICQGVNAEDHTGEDVAPLQQGIGDRGGQIAGDGQGDDPETDMARPEEHGQADGYDGGQKSAHNPGVDLHILGGQGAVGIFALCGVAPVWVAALGRSAGRAGDAGPAAHRSESTPR